MKGAGKSGLVILVICGLLAVAPVQAATKRDKAAGAVKERLVLMPLRVGSKNQNMQGAMETALVQGLQDKYEVFAGEDVAQKSREIFRKESRTAKTECDETRCMENIAIAFQSELIAVANVTEIDGGYLMALNIRNVMDNKVVYSNSLPCEQCSPFQVVEKLKVLSGTPAMATAPDVSPDEVRGKVQQDQAQGDAGLQEKQVWQAVEQAGDEASYRNYLSDYPRGSYVSQAKERIRQLQGGESVADNEQALWQVAQDRRTIQAMQAYLDKYPNGTYAEIAKRRIKKMREDGALVQPKPAQDSQSAEDRLRAAEAADKTKESSRLKVIPQYLEQIVVPAIARHTKDKD